MSSLSEAKIRTAKPKEKTQKLQDGEGLYLEITPKGGKFWRFRYPLGGKDKRIALGKYPSVGLKAARKLKDEARELLAQGIDPAEARRQEKERTAQVAEGTFEAVAKEWFERHLLNKSEKHYNRVTRRLERDAFPWLGSVPAGEIRAPDVLAVVERVEKRGLPETARRVYQNIGQVMQYAVATGRAEYDPTPALKSVLKPMKVNHMAAPTEPKRVGEVLRAFDGFHGGIVVATAVRILPYLFCRPGELRKMRWEDIDFPGQEWRFNLSKERTEHKGRLHIVPLSDQSIRLLQELRPVTGHLPGGWVFAGTRSRARPISDMAIGASYRRMGIDTRNELTPHGWRAVARTLLHEELGYAPDIIEHQLGHKVPDRLGTAYNRTRFLAQRKEMMQAWADYLDKLKVDAR